jgi:hypothetical protein
MLSDVIETIAMMQQMQCVGGARRCPCPFHTLCMYAFQPVPELQKIISEAQLRSEEECYFLSTKHEPRDP